MSYPGPITTPNPGADVGPPVLIPQLGRPARGGPPLWLGIVVMILGPIVFTVWAVVEIFTAMDLDSLMTPVSNPTSVTTKAGTTYVVASEQLGRRPCYTRQGGGPREPLAPATAETFDTPNGVFISRGGFSADEVAIVEVGCPRAGGRLLIFGIETDGLALRSMVLFGLAGLSFIGGLLMIIFRRRPARY